MTPLELNELITRAREGCGDSLGRLLEMNRNYLQLIARVQVGDQLRTKCSPSDLIQATFLQAQRGFSRFAGNSEAELLGWLRKILATQLATEIRRYSTQQRNTQLERRIHANLDQSSAMLGGMLAVPGNTPSQSAMRRERIVILADALAQLPDDYRDIIVARHFKGQSFSQIAEHTQRSTDSVKSAWRRAILKLRSALGSEMP